jgi:general secretion pathway protein M
VQIAIASARPGALIGWIADLEASGILVDRLGTTDNGDRTVAVQMTLKAQGQ